MNCKECMYFDKRKELCLIDLVEASEQGKNCRVFKSFEEVPEQMSEDKIKKELEELRKQYEELNDFSHSQCRKLLEENENMKEELKVIGLAFNDYLCSSGDECEVTWNKVSLLMDKIISKYCSKC